MGSTSKIDGKKPRVAICIPSGGMWQPAFGKSLMHLIAWTTPRKDLELMVLTKASSMLCYNRHNLAMRSIKEGATHILWLDDDMVFPKDTLVRLLHAKKPFVACNCTVRARPARALARYEDETVVDSRGKTGLEECATVGFGVAMTQTNIFMKTQPPFFLQDWVPATQHYCGEDIYFCSKMYNELGINPWIDHKLSQEILHLGTQAFGHSDIVDKEEPVRRIV